MSIFKIVMKVISILMLGTFLIQGIETTTEEIINEDGKAKHHPIIAFLTDLTFAMFIIIPMLYIAIN